MNLKQIEYSVAVVDNGSFSLAAKECYVTVQAVSKAIADLERELGRELFVRESRGVRPTEFGRAFYEKSLDVLRAFRELADLPRSYTEQLASDSAPMRLALYSPRFNNYELFCAAIERFLSKQVGFDVQVPLLSGTEVTQALRERSVDAFISIGAFADDDFDCVAIGTLSTAVVMGEDHPLASADEVSLEDIGAYPVLEAEQFDTFNESVLNTYRKHGLASEVLTPRTNEEYRSFVVDKQGLSFAVSIPAFDITFPGTVSRPIKPSEMVPISICLVTLKNAKTRAYRAVERMLKDAIGML